MMRRPTSQRRPQRSSKGSTGRSLAEINAEQRAARARTTEETEEQVSAQDEAIELTSDVNDPQATRHRVDLSGRLFAFFLDLGIVSGLSSLLIMTLHQLLSDTLKAYGFEFNGVMLSLPALFLYLSYFSTELTSGLTLGKRLLGIEVRGAFGQKAAEADLTKRAVMKHAGLMLFIGALISQNFILMMLAVAGIAFTLINLGFGFTQGRQCLHDRLFKLAVYPRKLPKMDLRRLAGGKSDKEIAAELEKARQERSAKGGKGRSKMPPAEAFPCGAELKIYTHQREGIEDELLECFTRFVQNVHPEQIKEFPPKGSYRTFKVVMRFATPLQMEASYEAVNKLEGVVTLLPTKLVRLPKQEGSSWLKRPARSAEPSAELSGEVQG
jgi:putative lipoic acid-binding regulatory protein